MKRIFAGLMCVMIVFSLCGCGEGPLPYNMIEIVNVNFKDGFLLEHSTYGVIHWRDYIDKDGNRKMEQWRDRESPSQRGVIIDNTEDFNEIFSYYDKKGMPDFETRMIVILFHTGYTFGFQKVINGKIKDDILYLDITNNIPSGVATGIEPGMLDYHIVEMDQYYITKVELWSHLTPL